MSASLLAKASLVEEWASILASDPKLIQHRYALDYYLAKAANRLDRVAALQVLDQRYEELDRSLDLAIVLFQELDPTDPAQAERTIDIAKRVEESTVLSIDASTQLAIALVTLKRWSDLLLLCGKFNRQFDAAPRLTAFEGLALDQLGRTAEARALLERMLDRGISDSLALNTYVNIATRCGFVEQAIKATEQILEGAKKPQQRMECIRLLFNLVQTSNPASPRLADLAIRMGELVDPLNEAQEGAHLSMLLLGTLDPTPPFQKVDKQSFICGPLLFSKGFPTQRYLKKLNYQRRRPAKIY